MELNQVEATRAYYDEFAEGYERKRRPNDPHGYHALLDDMQVDLVRRYGTGKDVLECGVGTGLLLERIAEYARSAQGIDLSPGMLARAKARGLDVREGSVTALPYADASFDVTCAFKVLAHVPEIGKALHEMARVTRPGGVVLAEFYNPVSLRGLVKRWGPARAISARTRESAVYTRFDAPWIVPRVMPPGVTLEAARGVRIVTPLAGVHRIPVVRGMVQRLEWALSDSKAAIFGGFYVAVLRRSGAA